MIKNLPQGWRVEELGNLVNFIIGKTPSRTNDEYFKGTHLWVSIADIKSKYLSTTKERITDEALHVTKIRKVQKGTLLLSYKLSIGKMAFATQDLYTNEAIAGLDIKSQSIGKEYLYYYLLFADLEKTTDRAVKGRTLNKAKLEQIPILLPPIPQQEKIVKVLDKSASLLEQQKQLIEKYDVFLKSKFIEMFGDPITNPMGWEVVKIDTVCNEIVDCVNRTAPIVDYETDFKMIRTTNVRNYKLIFNDTRYVEEEIYNQWVRRLVPLKHDVIFTREAPVGEAGIITSDDKLFLGQRTMLFRPNYYKINSYYLLFELMGSKVKNQIDKISSGSTVKHLSVPDCKKFLINLPSIELQNKFASIVEKIEAIKEKETQKLNHLETLHVSLMDKAFKGEIV